MAAAISAMQHGLDQIVVLEKSPFLGGNSRMAGGHLVCDKTDDKPGTVGTAEEVFREVIRFHHYSRVEPKLLRAFLDNTRGTIDYFPVYEISTLYELLGEQKTYDEICDILEANR